MIEDVVSAESYSYTYMDPPEDFWGLRCTAYSGYEDDYFTYDHYICGEQDDDDFTAADLCCACGGGLDEAPEPVVLAVSLTVEMDCADCALKGGGRARARARETTPCCWGGKHERARQRPPPPMGNDSDRESRKARRDVLTFAARARASPLRRRS